MNVAVPPPPSVSSLVNALLDDAACPQTRRRAAVTHLAEASPMLPPAPDPGLLFGAGVPAGVRAPPLGAAAHLGARQDLEQTARYAGARHWPAVRAQSLPARDYRVAGRDVDALRNALEDQDEAGAVGPIFVRFDAPGSPLAAPEARRIFAVAADFSARTVAMARTDGRKVDDVEPAACVPDVASARLDLCLALGSRAHALFANLTQGPARATFVANNGEDALAAFLADVAAAWGQALFAGNQLCVGLAGWAAAVLQSNVLPYGLPPEREPAEGALGAERLEAVTSRALAWPHGGIVDGQLAQGAAMEASSFYWFAWQAEQLASFQALFSGGVRQYLEERRTNVA